MREKLQKEKGRRKRNMSMSAMSGAQGKVLAKVMALEKGKEEDEDSESDIDDDDDAEEGKDQKGIRRWSSHSGLPKAPARKGKKKGIRKGQTMRATSVLPRVSLPSGKKPILERTSSSGSTGKRPPLSPGRLLQSPASVHDELPPTPSSGGRPPRSPHHNRVSLSASMSSDDFNSSQDWREMHLA